MTAALLKNELIKIRHRLAFWVTLCAFTGLLTLILGEPYGQELRRGAGEFVLPVAWRAMFDEVGPLGPFFAGVVLVMLVSNEFSWRTARQNVIDGLSKGQWFCAKLMLLPLVAVLFAAVQLVLGGGFAALVTDFTAPTAAIIGAHDPAAMLGYFFSMLGFCSLAFLLALAVRNSGPAIALFFLYIAIVEQLVLGPLMRRWGALAGAAGFLPGKLFFRLLNGVQYYPEAVARAAEAAAKAGQAAPVIPDTTHLMIAAGVYVAVFVSAGFMIYQRRDL